MKKFLIILFTVLLFAAAAYCAPIDSKDSPKSQSAFGTAFDEIVVESSLTVRRKPEGRQARNKNVSDDKKVKRQTTSSSASHAHAQSNNVKGNFGSFGSSATHSQTQSFHAFRNGLVSSVGLSGSQNYHFPNGVKINVNFANSGHAVNGDLANASSSSITFTNPQS